MSGTYGLIPVFRKGREIAAWALVDEDTFLWVAHHRWHLSQGYAMYAMRLRNAEVVNGNRPNIRCSMHRELMRLGHGDKRVVDHINGDKLDNRLENLRVLTLAQNGQNKPAYRDSTSKHRGVSWYAPREQWRVAIMVEGVRTLVGYFDDEDEAGAAAEVFYRTNVPYRRQESATAMPRMEVITASPGAGNSGEMEAHLVTLNPQMKG